MNNLPLLPISEYQKRFFLEWMLNPNSSAYNVSMAYKICGNLDKKSLKSACQSIIEKYELAHAQYAHDGSICHNAMLTIDDFYHEQQLANPDDAIAQIRKILKQPFNLMQGRLSRFYLLTDAVNPSINYFVISTHHIISDAMSAEILTQEIANNYNLLMNNVPIPKNRSKLFTDAVHAETQFLTSKNQDLVKSFWLNFIGDLPLVVDFPQHSSAKASEYKSIYFELRSTETLILKKFARENRTTMFIVLAALYGVILSRYSNQSKLLISYPINMRPQGYTNVTGCFVNNVPLKIDLDNHMTVSKLIENLTRQRKESKEHQWYSLTDIIYDQRKIRKEYDQSYFNVGFVEANLNAGCIPLDNLAAHPVDVHAEEDGVYLLSLQFDPRAGDSIKFQIKYQANMLDTPLISSFKDSFLKLIHDSTQPSQDLLLPKYNVLDNDDYQKIIHTWNQTEKAYPADKTIHQLFEEQVARTPDNIAVVYEDTKLTYQELNQKSNQLAHYLRDTYKIQGDDLLALCLDRNEHMLIAIFATLKSGAAYVPIDSTHPSERISFILSDTKAKVVVTNKSHVNMLEQLCVKNNPAPDMIAIDNKNTKTTIKQQPTANLNIDLTSNNLAYIIYTSGTTGNPKGVMIEHHCITSYSSSIVFKFQLDESYRSLLVTEYIFDLGYTNIFPILNSGGCLHVLNRDRYLDANYVCHYIQTQQINFIKATPLYIENILDEDISWMENIKYLILGGELASNQLLQKLSNQNMLCIVNHYGPTETTIGVIINTCFKLDQAYLGVPLFNTTTYVLDNNLNPLPIGAIGELYIGGAGLARGYLNLPELTTEKFIANPFQNQVDKVQEKNSRLYKTGDLVRYLPDGNIEYIVRSDFQVKIRGFRIELGEIENKLLSYPDIRQAVVIAREYIGSHKDGVSKYLVGYYVAEAKLDEDTLYAYLNTHLPEYMVPNALVYLEKLPLTINGKLDRMALPAHELSDVHNYVAPRNDLEHQICAIYAEVLSPEFKCETH